MTVREAVDAVYDGMVGPESLPNKLRERRGLDVAQLARVEAAMELLTKEYAGASQVPKRLAAALVDIQSEMQQGSAWYSEAEKNKIQDAADRLTSAAYAMLDD